MSLLALEGVTKAFGDFHAVADLDLDIGEGESVVLLGPSGCGKTTTLRMIAGFETPTSGTIRIGERVVAGPTGVVPPERRDVGVVFQSYALWPHMTVTDNVAFGLTTRGRRRPRRHTKAELADAAGRALSQVQLQGLGERYPHELSGGQQQRVALARALITDPSVLLLDEPLSNLDTRLREDMRFEIRRLQRESGITMVYITHDRTEALSLADRVVSLKAGRVQQIGPPEDLYQRPVSQFVAQSLGPANVMGGVVLGVEPDLRLRLVTGQEVTVSRTGAGTHAVGDELQVCVRPHDVQLTVPHTRRDTIDAADEAATNAVVDNRSFLGDETHYLLSVDGVPDTFRVFDRDLTNHDPGTRVDVRVRERKISILSERSSVQDDRRVDAA